MEIIDSIQKRRSIRNFKEDDISNDLVLKILDCGRLAPSAKNRQPWSFVIARGEVKNKIADLMDEWTRNNNVHIQEELLKAKNSVNPTAKVIRQAPVLILIFKEINENWTIGDNLSIGACVENICLSALEYNLGTLWIRDTVYVSSDISKLVGQEGLEMNCAVALGYPNEEPSQRPRKSLDSIVKFVE